jgi:hypothetical protein
LAIGFDSGSWVYYISEHEYIWEGGSIAGETKYHVHWETFIPFLVTIASAMGFFLFKDKK